MRVGYAPAERGAPPVEQVPRPASDAPYLVPVPRSAYDASDTEPITRYPDDDSYTGLGPRSEEED